MIGYACDDTLEFLQLEYAYTRRITQRIEKLYKKGEIKGIKLDAKSQVSAEFVKQQAKVDTICDTHSAE